MILFLFIETIFGDMTEFQEPIFHVYKYFEFLAYFILAFEVLQLILFILFIASILSENTRETP